MKNHNAEIKRIKARIEELKQIANADMGASYKEAVQTQDMIKMLEIRLLDLKNEAKNISNKTVEIAFISKDGNKLKVRVTTGIPDPGNNVFSDRSPIGSALLKLKKGENIKIRGITYVYG